MRFSSGHPFETLDSRRLLSAAVVDGTLLVVGTDHADTITVGYATYMPEVTSEKPFAPYYKVTINGKVSKFSADGIERVEVHAKDGNDFVNLNGLDPIPVGAVRYDPLNATIAVGSIVIGGKGNDTIYGGSRADSLEGDAGDDVLIGEAGNDTLAGCEGNDGLGNYFVESGNDILIGGPGDDGLVGGAGKDTLNGGSGNDTVNGYTGDDQVTGGPGQDHFFRNLDKSSEILDFGAGDINDGGTIQRPPL